KIDVVEKVFGPQKHGHIVGYGCGITTKQLKGRKSRRDPEIEERLQHREEEIIALQGEKEALQAEKEAIAVEKETIAAEKVALQRRMDTMEANFSFELSLLREMVMAQQATTSFPNMSHNIQNSI
ncbi:unnamed protein product, partial [Linum tenue]